MRLLAALLAALVLAPAASAAEALRVDAVDRPFALRVVDRGDGEVLRSVHGAGGAYGPLGFSFDLRVPVLNNAYLGYYVAAEADTAWFHATEVLERRGSDLVLATNDPLGHRITVSLRRVASGVVTLRAGVTGPLAEHVSTMGAAFDTEAGERFLGFGERSNAVDQTGGSVFSWAEEGPFSSGAAEGLLRPLVPGFTFPTGPAATNLPIPWLVSTRGLGVLIDQPHRSTFHLGDEREGAWRAEAEDDSLALTFVAGPEPAGVVRRYSAYAGRQPAPAPWILGPWFQATLEREPLEIAKRFRAEDVPVSVAQTYTHYLPCGAHVGREEAERKRVADHHALGYRITTYFNPHVCTTYQPVYDEAARAGLFVRDAAGEPYVLSNPFTADERVSEIDFTHPGGEELFGRLLDEALAVGYDGWMEDFGEYTPTDARLHDGTTGLESHNRYPVLYHCASYRHTRERDLAVFVRSGFHGVQPCARVVWGGDPTEDWSCADGLCAAVHQLLNTGLSGIAFQGSDIGGFHAIVNPRTSDELNARWIQVGAVSGVMRTQANGLSLRDDRAERSQVWHPAVLPIWRRYAKLRTQLQPYLAAAAAEYRRTGMPLARQLSLAFPGDARAARAQTEFLFGPDLLAAPVLRPGGRTRRLWVPRGTWLDFWDAVRFDERTGAFGIGSPVRLRGGRERELDAPLEELPMLIRSGALLPLTAPDVDTLAELGGDDVVSLGERRRRLRVLAFPQGRSRASFGARGRLISVRRGPSWTLRVRAPRRMRLAVQAWLPALRPCVVRGRGVRSWRRAGEVLHVRVRARRTRVEVRGCGAGRSSPGR